MVQAVPDASISAREAEVLAALGERLTNAEIATRLFISIRTVESHVSSLLRKLQAEDRRELADLAVERASAAVLQLPTQRGAAGALPPVSAPSPLTSFVGRDTERRALLDALDEHRLVTAVGPGGVGKTRLALSVVHDVSDRYADGAWYVDLVPVTDPSMVAAAIASALGLGEHQARSDEESLLDWFAGRTTLLVLDNCEHLLDGVVVLLERLLRGSPGLTVLATSRARLLAAFEWVFTVPGMSLAPSGDGPADAVELFVGRAAASGTVVPASELDRVAAICRGLDGMALAIELAAARLPSLGLDGLEEGLADHLSLLTGAARVDDRHRSLRSTLDWSYALLSMCESAVLRRVSVFAAPFSAEAAKTLLLEWKPVDCESIPAILAALAEQSLLVPVHTSGGVRYRAPETIRQYSAERMDEAGETQEAAARHLHWCLDMADLLPPPRGLNDDAGPWRAAFDLVADDLRAALGWATRVDNCPREAYRLAIRLAELTFCRGYPGESQRRYVQASELAAHDGEAADALRHAAGAAESRHFGNHALTLHRVAAEAALRAGDRGLAACELARAAELVKRGPGLMATAPPEGLSETLLAEAWVLASGDAGAEARSLVAEAFHGTSYETITAELSERAVVLARRIDSRLIESAALDQLTSVELARGDIRMAQVTAELRVAMLAPMPVNALSGMEHADALSMAAESALAAGDLVGARERAQRVQRLPFHREEGHLASARMLVVAVIAGDLDHAATLAERYREGWERAGRPRAGNLSRGAYAGATLHGLRGDDDQRAAWLDIVHAVATPGRRIEDTHFGEFFDALLWLHRGDVDRAFDELETPPEHFREWHNGMWKPWYAALWAETAALSGCGDVRRRLERARVMTMDNPIARAIVDRAAALESGDRDGLLRAAAALDGSGCRYQWARTLVLAGGEERTVGEQALAAIGTTPMVVPPG